MKDKATFKDLVNLNIKYVEYIRQKTYVMHQYVKNIQESGGETESEVRKLLRSFLPSRYKVTHGYIISATNETNEPNISPQVDAIVVDTMVPHSIFVFDDRTGIEVVPVEAVLGIFEVKRTLDKASLLGNSDQKGAIKQLCDIINSVGITKDASDRYIPGGVRIGGGLSGGSTSNPIVGILGIDHGKDIYEPDKVGYIYNIIQEIEKIMPCGFIDLIGSVNGFMYAIMDDLPPHNFKIANPRQRDMKYRYGIMAEGESKSKAHIVARILGYILAYLQDCCGRKADVQSYFFNLNL